MNSTAINMNRSQVLAKRFREVMLNGRWIANTNFKDQLSGMSLDMAMHQIADLNTIALLAQHIHYYISGINQVLRGGSLDIKDQFSFDFAPFNEQPDWEQFLLKLWEDSESFASMVEDLSDDQLEAVFVKDIYGSYQRNIDAMIEHAYYHLGQVVLLRKLMTEK